MCEPLHHILAATSYRVAESGHERKGGTSERLKQIAVAKTISECELGDVGHAMIQTGVETVIAIALRRGRDEVLEWYGAMGKGKCGGRATRRR